MDVLRIVTILLLGWNLSACGPLGNLFGGDGDNEELPSNEKFTEPTLECEGSAIPSRFIVKWKSGEISVINSKNRRVFFDEVFLKLEDEIEVAEYDFVIRLDDPSEEEDGGEEDDELEDDDEEAEEEDPFLNWGVERIKAQSVWDQGHTGQGIIVAVIDSGADITHPELAGQLFVNSGEVADNGEDDDGNGLIDDVSGWDFFENKPLSGDLVGHGSHVSGIIAARHDVGKVLGTAPGVALLPLNFMDEDGAGTLGDAVSAIDYAVSMGAQVINASWGGAPCSEILKARIEKLEDEDVLFIAAAGNNGVDLVDSPEFPASFDLIPQITVGASTQSDFMAGFSNHSREFVHLVAPGHNIVSTVPDFDNETKSGTSMATPFVAAAAALIWSAVPEASALQVKNAILNSVDDGPFEVKTDGRLNVEAALQKLQSSAP